MKSLKINLEMNRDNFVGLAVAADALRLVCDILEDHAGKPAELEMIEKINGIAELLGYASDNDLTNDLTEVTDPAYILASEIIDEVF